MVRDYGVPRTFDLATLFAMSMGYALLFGAMRSLEFPQSTCILVAAFITWVGIAQAVLFGGKLPRESSIVAGVAFFVAYGGVRFILTVAQLDNYRPTHLIISIISSIFGVIPGYLAGVLVAGVFLVADRIRAAQRRWFQRK